MLTPNTVRSTDKTARAGDDPVALHAGEVEVAVDVERRSAGAPPAPSSNRSNTCDTEDVRVALVPGPQQCGS